MNPTEGKCTAWPQTSFIVMCEEFGFVGRHIHVDGTISFASLAGEAKVQCLFDVIASPTFVKHFAVHHFKQQSCSATGGMHLLTRHHVAGTHGPAALATAFTNA